MGWGLPRRALGPPIPSVMNGGGRTRPTFSANVDPEHPKELEVGEPQDLQAQTDPPQADVCPSFLKATAGFCQVLT